MTCTLVKFIHSIKQCELVFHAQTSFVHFQSVRVSSSLIPMNSLGTMLDVLRHGGKYIYHLLIPRSLPSLCHIYWWAIMGASQHSLWMINSWQILVGAWSSLLWQVYTPTVDYIRHCRQYMNTHCWLSITKEVKGRVQQAYISEIAHPTGLSSVK